MITLKKIAPALFLSLLASATFAANTPIKEKHYGTTMDGQEVTQTTLTNNKGSSASFINYGAIVTNLLVPDRDGKLGDVVLGYDNLKQYELSGPSMCNLVGRFANRIGNASFTLDNTTYQLSANQGVNTLHGGMIGIGKRVWKNAGTSITPDGPAVRYTILDPDGAEGFPGNLNITVIFTLTNDNILKIQMLATTDKATPINLSSHCFFNLSGGKDDVLNYIMKVPASHYLPMDAALVPTGQLAPVANTPYDFTKAKTIARDLKGTPGATPGYDHTLVLDNPTGKLAKAAEVYDPNSGRLMECFTTEPAVHFTNGKNLANLAGKDGATYKLYAALTIETQHFSDSPNHPEFPSTILRPGQAYHQLSEFKFSVPTKPLTPE